MRNGLIGSGIAILAIGASMAFCGRKNLQKAEAGSWELTKSSQMPVTVLKSEFGVPVRQAASTLVWEDGIYVSRDGLALYTDYFQADMLSIVFAGVSPTEFYKYQRGPGLGQDFSNPINKEKPWIHSDIAYSVRASVDKPFGPWRLSKLTNRYYNMGGPATIASPTDPNRYDYVIYTTDNPKGPTLKLMRNVGRELAPDDQGVKLPPNVDDPRYHTDNPSLERPSLKRKSDLILFFDSDDRPGLGQHDLFWCESKDGGTTWSDPVPVKSVNSPADEQQPHLYFDGHAWWLYLTATNKADGKLGIFRCRQKEPGIWDAWGPMELVVSAGTAVAIGEPTLTARGDISCVVITKNPKGTPTDAYDGDPWFIPHRK